MAGLTFHPACVRFVATLVTAEASLHLLHFVVEAFVQMLLVTQSLESENTFCVCVCLCVTLS